MISAVPAHVLLHSDAVVRNTKIPMSRRQNINAIHNYDIFKLVDDTMCTEVVISVETFICSLVILVKHMKTLNHE